VSKGPSPGNLWVIGYGTLLLQASLGTSIRQNAAAAKHYVPVVVQGYRRLFNIRPDHYVPSHKLATEAEEAAAMNIETAPAHHFNGLAFCVTAEELRALDRRECCYKRHQVSFSDFKSREILGEAAVYVGCEPWIVRDPKRLMPLWRDIVWARHGAYQYGEAFGASFDETTYLADGATRVIDVYREQLADPGDVDFPNA